MPYTMFAPALYLMSTPGAAYNTSSTITDVSTNPQYVMPPYTITTVGQGLNFVAGGVYSSTTGPPTLILGVYKNTQTTGGGTGVGGAALGASSALAVGTSQSNQHWRVELDCTFNAVGASGSMFSSGLVFIVSNSTTTTLQVIPATTPQTAVSFDTTKATILSVGATWGTNSASNTLVCNLFQIRVLT